MPLPNQPTRSFKARLVLLTRHRQHICERVAHNHTRHRADVLSAINSNNGTECLQAHDNLYDHSGKSSGFGRGPSLV